MSESVGVLLRQWRHHRRLSQLDLAGRSGVSTRHLSCIETGRAAPSSAMILRLCGQLQVPLREQNQVLHAAGFAPEHPEYAVTEPPMQMAAEAIETVLTAHLPYPALALDGGWDLVAANDAVYSLLEDVHPDLLAPPVNIFRLSLDPRGLAPRIVNLPQWRDHLLGRLRREYDHSRDPRLGALLAGVERAPGGSGQRPGDAVAGPGAAGAPAPPLIVPSQLRLGDALASFLSTTTVFGTPREVTLSELAVEVFYPADQHTRQLMAGAGLNGGRTG